MPPTWAPPWPLIANKEAIAASNSHCQSKQMKYPELAKKLPAAMGGSSKLMVNVEQCFMDSEVEEILYFGNSYEKVIIRTLGMRLYYSPDSGRSWSLTTSQSGAPAPWGTTGPDSSALPVQRIFLNAEFRTVLAVEILKGSNKKGGKKVLNSQHGTTMYTTPDGGKHWQKVNIPNEEQSHVGNIIWHPTKRSWALVSWFSGNCDAESCMAVLMLTKDFGKTFRNLQSHVVDFSWGSKEHKQENRVYFSHHRHKHLDHGRLMAWIESADLSFIDLPDVHSHSDQLKTVDLVVGGNLFTVQKNFLIVVKVIDEESQTTALMVSTDGQNLKHSIIPGMGAIKVPWIQILDSQDDVIVVHVEGKNSSEHAGALYVSDSSGYQFTFSLDHNWRSENMVAGFEKILSMDGVYMANVLMPVDERFPKNIDNRVRTAISFDKGAVWSYVKRPAVDVNGKRYACEKLPEEECSLHLHVTAPDDTTISQVYTSKSSVGVIIGTGNVGRNLEFMSSSKLNTYLSRDGGNTWFEIAQGAHIYEISDHGGLILIAKNQEATDQIWYSYDAGHSWNIIQLAKKITVQMLVTDSDLSTTNFIVAGKTTSDQGLVAHLSFDDLLPTCVGADKPGTPDSNYELWSPHDPSSFPDSCLMGRHIVYTRKKWEAACIHGKMFERPIETLPCPCKVTDFTCEAGYARESSGLRGGTKCMKDENHVLPVDFDTFHTPAICTGSYNLSHYVKVSGNKCKGGWVPPSETIPCPFNYSQWTEAPFLPIAIGAAITIFASLLVKCCRKGGKSKSEKQ